MPGMEVVQLKVTTIEQNGKVRVKVQRAGPVRRFASAVGSKGGLLRSMFVRRRAVHATDSETVSC